MNQVDLLPAAGWWPVGARCCNARWRPALLEQGLPIDVGARHKLLGEHETRLLLGSVMNEEDGTDKQRPSARPPTTGVFPLLFPH